MTTPQPEEQGETAPIELPGHQPPPSPLSAPPPEPAPPVVADLPPRTVLEPAVAVPAESHEVTTYVPLAVTVGDGFKFGCGFFLAMVIAMLIGFVLVTALFVLTGLLGLNPPISP